MLLGGSWGVISGVINKVAIVITHISGVVSKVAIVITHIRGLMTPFRTTHDPPCGVGGP